MNYTSQKTTFQTYTNGTSPRIGADGYWYIGDTNTKIKAQGADALTMLLSNDSDIIVRNNLGAIVGELPTTEVFVLQGATEVAKATITPTPPTDFIENGGKYTFTEDNKLTINKLPEGFTAGAFTFEYADTGISKTFSLKVVSSEVDYNLVIDKTLINSTEEGGTVKITVKKISADGTKILEEPAGEKKGEVGVQLRINNDEDYASSWQIEYDKGDTTAIPVKLEVQVGNEWVVWDKETIEFVANGAPGGDGASLQVIYKADTTVPDGPTGETPSGWYTNMPTLSEGERIYMSQKMSNSTIWSAPVQISAEDGLPGKDGGDIEYVYYLCNNDETHPAPTTPPSYNGTTLTSGWTPSPSGITPEKQYEYVSVRTKPTGGNWNSFSTPVIWSKWGDKGQDGDGVTYHYCLTNSDEAPIYPKPDEKSYNWTPDPQGVTKSNQYEYVVAIKTGEEVNSSNTKTGKLWAKWSEDGAPSVAYWLVASSSVIAKGADGAYKTTSITFTPMMQTGSGNPEVCKTAFLASWKDNESALTSGTQSEKLEINLGTDAGKTSVEKALHCRMFIEDSDKNQVKVDEQTAEVLTDGATGTIKVLKSTLEKTQSWLESQVVEGVNTGWPIAEGEPFDDVKIGDVVHIIARNTTKNADCYFEGIVANIRPKKDGNPNMLDLYVKLLVDQGEPGAKGETAGTITLYKRSNIVDEKTKQPTPPSTSGIGGTSLGGWGLDPDAENLVPTSTARFLWKTNGTYTEDADGNNREYDTSWTTPELHSAYYANNNVSGSTAAEYYKLFGTDDTNQGMKFNNSGQLYINASMINAGTLTITKGGEGDDKTDVLFSAGWGSDDVGSVKIGQWQVVQNSIFAETAPPTNTTEPQIPENIDELGSVGMYCGNDWTEKSLLPNGGCSPVRFYAGLKKNNDTGEITINFLVLEDGSTYMTAAEIGHESIISNGAGSVSFQEFIDKHNTLNENLRNYATEQDQKYTEAELTFKKNFESINTSEVGKNI